MFKFEFVNLRVGQYPLVHFTIGAINQLTYPFAVPEDPDIWGTLTNFLHFSTSIDTMQSG